MNKILYIVTKSEIGGAQRYVFDLATNLPKDKWEVHVAAGGNGPFFTDFRDFSHIYTHRLAHLQRNLSIIRDPLAYVEISALLKQIQPHVVHLNSTKAGTIGAWAAHNTGVKNIIYTAHGFVFNEPLNPVTRFIYKTNERMSAWHANHVITVSEYDYKTGIGAGISPRKLTTIHNAINMETTAFLPRAEARNALSRIMHRSFPSGFILGAIGNFYHNKGMDVLIKTMEKIPHPLVIIGDGALRERYERLIKKLGLTDNIILAGTVSQAGKFVKAFNAFVLPSRKEGLPYSLLEASAARVPIVGTKVGGVPEIITHGVNGYLADANNTDSLAHAIRLCIEKPRQPLVAGDFKFKTMLEKTIALYKTL